MTNEEWAIGDACVITTNEGYQRAKVVRLTATRVMIETTMFDGRKIEEAYQKKTGDKVGHYGWGAPPRIEHPSTDSTTWFQRRATAGAARGSAKARRSPLPCAGRLTWRCGRRRLGREHGRAPMTTAAPRGHSTGTATGTECENGDG